MKLHIYCIFQFCRSPGRTGSGLFRFRSGSALATASYQHFIARKHTHLPGSSDRRASPGRVALGLAAPGPPSAGLSAAWPSISSRSRRRTSRTSTPRNDAGSAAAAPPAGAAAAAAAAGFRATNHAFHPAASCSRAPSSLCSWLRISRPSPSQTLADWPSHALHGLA